MQTDIVVMHDFVWARMVLALMVVAVLVAMTILIVRNRAWSSVAIATLVGLPVLLILIRFVRMQGDGQYTVLSLLSVVVFTVLAVMIALIVRRAPRSGVAIAALVGVPLLLIVLSLLAYRDVARPTVMTAHAMSPHRADAELTRLVVDRETNQPPLAWRVEVDEQFLPDIYASHERAQRALARHLTPLLVKALKRTGEETSGESSQIVIRTDENRPVNESVLDAMRASLATDFPDTQISVSPDSSVGSEDGSADTIDVAVATARGESAEPDTDRMPWGEAGEIAVEVRGQDGEWTVSVPYVQAPWVHGELAGDHYARVRTSDFASSREQAEAAVQEATLDALAELFSRYPFANGLPARFDRRKEIRRSLRDWDSVLANQFTQQLKMENGDSVYRSAALIDTNLLEPMFAAIVEKQQNRGVSRNVHRTARHKERSYLGGLGGLLLAVVGVFFGLKRITQKMTESHHVAGSQ